MPSKGYSYSRDTVICKKLFDKFIASNPSYKDSLTYELFREIIERSNAVMFDVVVNDQNGFKLPENLGYVVVARFKPKKKAKDYFNSKKYGKDIYHLNLHSFGYTSNIRWFKAGIARFSHSYIYKFIPSRLLKRAVAKKTLEGAVYLEWKMTDFWKTSKLERMFRKRFKITE